MVEKNKTLIIIDSNSIIHRAYHALPRLTTKKGELVNAVYGFLLVFFKAIKDFQPNYIAATFDMPGPTFRHKQYKEYKAKRPPVAEELYKQFPLVKEVLKSFNVQVFEKEGFEADDIIGTIAFLASKEQRVEIIILSGDLDALQLVDSRTKVYSSRRGVKDVVLYDEKLVKEKFGGLNPGQMLDFKALRGDPSDNIPGVTGIGEKTAIDLLLKFGGLDNLYKEIEEKSHNSQGLVKSKLKETLLQNKEQAFFSRSLVRLEKKVPVDFNFKKCTFGGYNKEKVIQTLKELEFYSLIGKLPVFGKQSVEVRKNLRLW